MSRWGLSGGAGSGGNPGEVGAGRSEGAAAQSQSRGQSGGRGSEGPRARSQGSHLSHCEHSQRRHRDALHSVTQKATHTVTRPHTNTKVHSDTNTRCPQEHSGHVWSRTPLCYWFLPVSSVGILQRLGHRGAKRVIYHKTGPGLRLLSNRRKPHGTWTCEEWGGTPEGRWCWTRPGCPSRLSSGPALGLGTPCSECPLGSLPPPH